MFPRILSTRHLAAAVLVWLVCLSASATVPYERSEAFLLRPYRNFDLFKSGDLALDEHFADNIVTWQLPNGGFGKENELNYLQPWNGQQPRSRVKGNGVELGSFDNNATINETRFLADMFNRTRKDTYRQSVNRALQFVLNAQYPTGAWPQVYPRRTGSTTTYSNDATFNDDVMARVMLMIDDILDRVSPFDSDVVDPALLQSLRAARERGMAFILRSQIVVNGIPTVWCQQHDPVTYQPSKGRAYELPGKSGNESVGVTAYLLTRHDQDAAIRAAAAAALHWFDKVRVDGKHYAQYTDDPVSDDSGYVLWYRYYNLDDDRPFFAGRDGVKKFDISEIEQERRRSYQWGGYFAQKLLSWAQANQQLRDAKPLPLPAPRLVYFPYLFDMKKNRVYGHFGVSPRADVAITGRYYRIDDGPEQAYTEPFLIDRNARVTLRTQFSDGSRMERSYPVEVSPQFNKLNYSIE